MWKKQFPRNDDGRQTKQTRFSVGVHSRSRPRNVRLTHKFVRELVSSSAQNLSEFSGIGLFYFVTNLPRSKFVRQWSRDNLIFCQLCLDSLMELKIPIDLGYYGGATVFQKYYDKSD